MLYKLKRHKIFLSAIDGLNTELKKWKLLGSGSYGKAYDMGDGRVCKITTNERETKAAKKLKNSKKNFSYLYKILDVLVLKKGNKFWRGLIITPKYKKLTDNQKAELYELFCFLELTPSFRLSSMKQIKDKIKKAVNDYYVPLKAQVIVNSVIRKRMKIFKRFNILYILRNLKAANLGPEDMHYENILKDEGHYILIDIAC